MDQSLLDYIAKQRAAGTPDSEIRSNLLANGWDKDDVAAAFHGGSTPAVNTHGQLPGVWTLLRQSLVVYEQQFWVLLGLTVLPGFMAMLIAGAGGALAMIGAGAYGTQLGFVIPAVLVGVALMAVVIYVAVWGQLAFVIALRDRADKAGLREYVRRARPLIKNFFLLGLLSGVISIGATLLFIVPGIIFSVWFGFAGYLLVANGEHGFAALAHSRALVAGRFWRIVWRFFAVGLLAVVVGFAIELVFGSIGVVMDWFAGIAPLLSVLFRFVLAPVTAIYSYLVFEAVREIPAPESAPGENQLRRQVIIVSALGYLALLVVIVLALT